jgi:glucose/arabinose dehydrogenase
VDDREEGKEYGIPDESPFKDQPELGLPEIFAIGFRNPWKGSIDGIKSYPL